MKYIPIFLLTCFFAACDFSFESTKTLNVPYKAQVVVNGIFTPDSLWSVHVSETVPAVGKYQDLKPIKNAEITLYEGNTLLEKLQHIEEGFYFSFTRTPQIGKTYTLKVNVAGFDPVEATATLPKAPDISLVSKKIERLPNAPDDYGERRIEFGFQLKDAANSQDYYGFILQNKVRERREDLPNDIRFYEGYFRGEFDHIAIQDGEADSFGTDGKIYCYNECPFADVLLNGKTEIITMKSILSLKTRQWNWTNATTGQVFKYSVIYEPSVRFMSLSKELYQYLKAKKKQEQGDSSPFSEPVNIQSNIKGGLGIFAGYISKEWQIVE